MYLKLAFNYRESTYTIPTATDGTILKLPEDHTAVKYMNAINPPHTLKGMEKFSGIIYALPSKYDPSSTHSFDRNTQYFIKI